MKDAMTKQKKKYNTMTLKSQLSHSPDSSRVYLMHLHPDDFPEIIPYMENLAQEKEYTKLFAKIPAKYGPLFLTAGYVIEASIPSFFNGKEDALFLMKYLNEQRKQPEQDELKLFQELLLKPANKQLVPVDREYTLSPLQVEHAEAIVTVFKAVFETYPFPIFDPEYIRKTMVEDGTRYFGIYHNNQLVAVSSAECDKLNKNAEMTDFAVIPSYRGKSFAAVMLSYMEEELKKDGFLTFYTIARLHSLPMNKTFYNLGYRYSGTLNRNTQIAGKIESMNVWYKNVL